MVGTGQEQGKGWVEAGARHGGAGQGQEHGSNRTGEGQGQGTGRAVTWQGRARLGRTRQARGNGKAGRL